MQNPTEYLPNSIESEQISALSKSSLEKRQLSEKIKAKRRPARKKQKVSLVEAGSGESSWDSFPTSLHAGDLDEALDKSTSLDILFSYPSGPTSTAETVLVENSEEVLDESTSLDILFSYPSGPTSTAETVLVEDSEEALDESTSLDILFSYPSGPTSTAETVLVEDSEEALDEPNSPDILPSYPSGVTPTIEIALEEGSDEALLSEPFLWQSCRSNGDEDRDTSDISIKPSSTRPTLLDIFWKAHDERQKARDECQKDKENIPNSNGVPSGAKQVRTKTLRESVESFQEVIGMKNSQTPKKRINGMEETALSWVGEKPKRKLTPKQQQAKREAARHLAARF